MYEVIAAAHETSVLSDFKTWDIVLVVGAVLMAWLGWSTRANALHGVVRVVGFLIFWGILFLFLMFFGGILGAAGEAYVNR